ncbi:MAG: hypothetical protein VB878_10200 [Pirellulaceae bacterium]
MDKMTRRAVLSSVATTAVVGLGAKTAVAKLNQQSPSKQAANVKSMTLQEFREMNMPVAVDDLFNQIEGHTFMMCHEEMRKKHGIWIPELVPVFEKLDAVRAATG